MIQDPKLAPSWRRELAAVCCYFNPCHYHSRLRNYHLFREALLKTGIHLKTVELAFGSDEFELRGVDNVSQVRTPDVMWQKERLLNIGIEQLAKEGFTKAAWVDADVLFSRTDWPEAMSRSLDQASVVQAYTRADIRESATERVHTKVGAIVQMHQTRTLVSNQSHTGLAWGARMDLLRPNGLYDAAIVGGADELMLHAVFFRSRHPQGSEIFNRSVRHFRMNPARRVHFEAWAESFSTLIDGRIGWIAGTVESLPHGTMAKRRYLERQRLLAEFDPVADLARNADGCWTWATAKPAMHQNIRNYFQERQEDE